MDFSSLKCFIVGAAPFAPEKFKEAVRLFGPIIYEGFGQTETLFPLVIKSPSDYLNNDGSLGDEAVRAAGKAVPGARIGIMDDDGNLLPAGERGEIVVRSSMTMQGYYKRPKETPEVSQFGWHHTSDIGIIDVRGFLTIVDRKKDMILSGDFNIYPVEIEKVIQGHPSVLDSIVVGVPDEKWGEAVKAVVQLKPGQIVCEEDLIARCKAQLGSAKAPKSLEFWPEHLTAF